jgi:tyrosyl-tRNA synthetase
LLRYFTFLDHDTIRSLDDAIKSAPQERAAQRTLANEVVALVHGEDAAKNAERAGEASLVKRLPHWMKRPCYKLFQTLHHQR